MTYLSQTKGESMNCLVRSRHRLQNAVKSLHACNQIKLQFFTITQKDIFITDSDLCPVKLFQLYISKLNPKCDNLWQKPKVNVKYTDEIWYDNVPIGQHLLDNFMIKLSESAHLSKIYTNHCIRSTCITNLDNCGFEARHITAVSGHKSETTIKHYSVKCPASKKRQMSDVLSEKFLGQNIQSPAKHAKLVPKENPVGKQNTKTDSIDLNFYNWIPIENNANDFDLGKIIAEVDQMQGPLPQSNTVVPAGSVPTPNPYQKSQCQTRMLCKI